jgi:Fe2+ transport system protein FeoA
VLQLSFNRRRRRRGRGHRAAGARCLLDLAPGEQGLLDAIDLPEAAGRRLMQLGFIPGVPVAVVASAPGGDPLVFRVDGSEVALRRETAEHVKIRRPSQAAD